MSDSMTPSQQIIAAAQQSATVKDSRGRDVSIRRVAGAIMARFIRACGPAADIQTYFGEAIIRASVTAVDGVPVPFPRTAAEVDGLWDRVDQDAAVAAANWFAEQADAKAADPLADKPPAT